MSDAVAGSSAQDAPSAAAPLSQIALERQKYGCTCNRCIGGYLSPRMRMLLEIQASLAADQMLDIHDFSFDNEHDSDREDNDSDDEDCRKPEFFLNCEFVPSEVYDQLGGGVTGSFYEAYAKVFEVASKILQLRPRREFNAEVLGSYAQAGPFVNKTLAFFDYGGEAEFVIDAITHNAKEEHRMQEEGHEDDPDYLALPKCKNDFNFGLVRKCLGLKRDRTWGPYRYDH